MAVDMKTAILAWRPRPDGRASSSTDLEQRRDPNAVGNALGCLTLDHLELIGMKPARAEATRI